MPTKKPQFNLTPGERRILDSLATYGAQTRGELVRTSGVMESTAVSGSESLVRQGLAEWCVSTVGDMVKKVRLTEKGRAL